MPPQINLHELYGMQKKKTQNRTVCFDHIIELCHRRIRTIASYSGQNTFYEIPGIVIGYPLYDINECIHYVISALRQNGFLVQILPPPHIGVVYISWDPRELRAQYEHNHLAIEAPGAPKDTRPSSSLMPSATYLMNNRNANGMTRDANKNNSKPNGRKKSKPFQPRLF